MHKRQCGEDTSKYFVTLIWDEYIANILSISGKDKKKAGVVMNKVSEIIMLGRSLFIRLIIATQVMEIRDSQSFMYQLTINNPKEKGWTHEHILKVLRENFKTLTYICMADEQGSCYHTHIFVVFASRVRFSMVKRYFEEAHIEKCKGSVSDNVNYIKKTGRWETDESKQEKKIEGTFEEVGTQPPDSKGRRRDLTELYQMVMENMSNMEILSQNQDYLLILDKIDRVRTTILTEKYKETVRLDLEVVYISGATGTGKTRGVLEKNGYSNVFRVTDYAHPFDSYNCQPVIAFEEFRSSMRISEMLLYCDIYPIELPARFSNKYACYNKRSLALTMRVMTVL